MAKSEELTEREKTALKEGYYTAPDLGFRAVAIIDAHAAVHAALVAQVAELTRERDEALKGVSAWCKEAQALKSEVTRLTEALAAAERDAKDDASDIADWQQHCFSAEKRAEAAEARVEALETLLAASEARAEQWKADAESYRADATVAKDRLAALQERVNSVIEQAPDGFQVDAASLKRVLRG